MRFVIDENADVEVQAVLTRLGHKAWTVAQAKRSRGDDVDQVLYAHEQKAVFVTHDRELITSRYERPDGRYLRLKCLEFDAPGLIEEYLPDFIEVLARRPYLVVTLSPTGFDLRFGTERGNHTPQRRRR